MLGKLSEYFSNSDFMPHGHCYLWKPSLVWTMVTTDLLIGLAYVSISASLYWPVRKIRLPFSAMFVAFGFFILACGATHFMDIYTLWSPNYWLAALVKVITATASVITAIYMFPIAPKVMGLAKTVELSESRGKELQRAYQEMERRVEQRTRDLNRSNDALREREERLREQSARLEEALETRDEFLSIASHELKTPLSSLRLQLELANLTATSLHREDPTMQKFEKMLLTAERQVGRMTALVEELLDVSRIRAGKLTPNYEEMDLREVAKDVIERLYSQMTDAKCCIDLSGDASVTGEWDRSRIDQIFVNLVSNAIKYAPGKPIHIRIHALNSDMAEFSVQDAGDGISLDRQRKIFERFERAEASRNIGGLGLGLFITKQIVEAHRGTITLRSDVGQGALFLVRLPRRR
ncbi:MAG: HAMP domain-containing histidine kinase [Bdellovibrionales bacterium]|nr:HAMP domain-containing histidine kinase [Bdellovibrionales bacterium]